MILSNIKQFFTNNKKIFYYLWFFLIVFSFSVDFTFANDSAKDITKWVSALMQWIGVLLAMATYLTTMFLSPEWINGSLFWLNSHFRDVWILVSNVVYFIFAFVLIWIAFMNIIWKTSEQYQLKQALPKFIVWVLIVPFSWFLVQFILSLSAILTVSALSLPFDTFSQYESKMVNVIVPSKCTLDLSSLWKDWNSDWFIKCDWKKNFNDIKDNWNSIQSIFGVISLYTYWILSFDSIDKISEQLVKEWYIKWLWDLVVKVLFDALFIVIYSILIITLAIVLMVRWIYIWIYTMVSPIFWLMYFFDKKDGWDWFFWKFNIKEFIALAMVPVYTMLALSFGLLFIYVIWENIVSNEWWWNVKIKESWTWTLLTLSWFDLEIKWAVWSIGSDNVSNFFGTINKEWKGALWTIWSLILKVFGLVVLWGSIMAAMRTSDITKAITQPIYDFGNKVWGIVASAPGNIPVFGGKSATELSSAAWTVQSSIQWHFSSKWAEWWQSISPFSETKTSNLKVANSKYNKIWSKSEGYVENHVNALGSNIKELWAVLKNDSERKEFMEMIKTHFWDNIYKSVKDKKTETEFYNTFKNEAPKNKDQMTTWGQQFYDNVLKNKNTEQEFVEVFEKWNIDSSWEVKNKNNKINKKDVFTNSNWVNIQKIEINWRTINWKLDENWNVDSFTWIDDYKDIAKYVKDNNLNKDWFKNLMGNLEVSESDKIKKEISKYFKDWKIDLTQDDWGIKDLDDFLDKEE